MHARSTLKARSHTKEAHRCTGDTGTGRDCIDGAPPEKQSGGDPRLGTPHPVAVLVLVHLEISVTSGLAAS
jgi:hypothetical protein